MATTVKKIDYLSAAARAADKVYTKVVELHCVHKSGANTWAELLAKKRTTCAASASITYQLAGILPTGKTVNHRKAVGGSDANILKKKSTITKAMKGASNVPKDKATVVWVGKKYADLPAKYREKGVIYIQDSNVCLCAGGGAIYSCNNAKGSQVDSKGRYVKDKIISGYAFRSPILVAIVPKVIEIKTTTTTTPTKEVTHDMDMLRNGDKGQQVKVLQKLLGGLDVDGIWGPKTDAAVRAYQKKHKLEVDGIVGPKTWGALLS